jgi:hypothetical protein
MADIRIKHYRVRRNDRGFWEPRPYMRAAGFVSTPCGPDGPSAWAIAEEMNARWLAVKRGDVPAPALAGRDGKLTPEQADDLIPYRPGSIGAGFKTYRKTDVWLKDKKPRTREDWMRGWRYIGPVFGHKDPRTITLTMISAFRSAITDAHGVREAHRVIKIWRALWKVNGLNKLCHPDHDPSKAFENRAAAARDASWLEAEVIALAERAWKLGYHGVAAIIMIAWDTSLSPVDVRTLRASQMASAGRGEVFFTKRAKTDVPVGGMLRGPAMIRLADYLERLGVTLTGDAFIFRNRSGAPYSKDTLGDDFRAVRLDLCGPDEKRTLADFRRSATKEAHAGGARPEALAHQLGNSFDRCVTIFRTYCPANVTSLREVAEAREHGAKLLAEEHIALKRRNSAGQNGGTPSTKGA